MRPPLAGDVTFHALSAPDADTECAALREWIDVETDGLLQAAGSLQDPLWLEYLATVFDLALGNPLAPAGFSEMGIESLESRGVEGATVLAATAKLGSKRAVTMAEAALERLRERGVRPRLPPGLGERELEEAVMYTMMGNHIYAFRLRQPGAERVQVASIVVEKAEGGGNFDHALMTDPLDPDAAAEAMTYLSDTDAAGELRRTHISAEQLAQTLRDISARTREREIRIQPPALQVLRLLAGALGIEREALELPVDHAISPLQISDDDEKRFGEFNTRVVKDFEHWIEKTGEGNEALHRNGGYFAESMLEWKWRSKDGDLGRWRTDDVKEFLLDFAPRELSGDDQHVADGPSCIAGFLSFLGAARLLAGDPLPLLVACCEDLQVD